MANGQEAPSALFNLINQGARYLAPNALSLLMGEGAPPLPNVPDVPGKVPPTTDPRGFGSIAELMGIGENFIPGPGPAKVGGSLLASLMGAGMKRVLPEELFHVVGKKYKEGQPLLSLYKQHGNKAYDMFNKRWPDAGADMGVYHANQTMFYDNLKDAQEHAQTYGGKVLKVDPKKVNELFFDEAEKPGFWSTRESVDPDAFVVVPKLK